MSDPPPTPVMPTRNPTKNPDRTYAGMIACKMAMRTLLLKYTQRKSENYALNSFFNITLPAE